MKKQKFEKAEKLTHKMTELKNKKLNMYMRPRQAFIIFRYQ